MFSSNGNDDQRLSSTLATNIIKTQDELLGFRIALQRPLEIIQRFPVAIERVDADDDPSIATFFDERDQIAATLKALISDILKSKVFCKGTKDKSNVSVSWSNVLSAQENIESQSRWKEVLNKWHARMNFGSDHVKNKLKVFNRTFWDQIEDTLSDETRAIEKSRMPLSESCRIDRIVTANKKDVNSELHIADEMIDDVPPPKKSSLNKQFDLEVYDDRTFYSHLLKSFISNAASDSFPAGTAEFQALKNLKKRKAENVERKASKGRKIRYKVHTKLQHFMFPIPAVPTAGLDVDRLFVSLFQ
mmetsp:Transcript_6355/g.9509  ORF Transcript_6355/g.9509 Transcript_6355/m.9509 type:complete len:303 (+) Transcript_6355:3-911(+)